MSEQTTSPAPLHHQQSIVVHASAEDLYDLVSDVTRTGEWSPICQACWWDDQAQAATVGAWFTGRNVTATRTWETRSQVVAAARGREFAWLVGEGYVRWGFTLDHGDDGTLLTESWDFLPAGLAFFREKYADQADAQVQDRTDAALSGIPVTLAAIKRIAEQGA